MCVQTFNDLKLKKLRKKMHNIEKTNAMVIFF